MISVLMKQDLEPLLCQVPNCPGDHALYIRSRCHPAAGVAVGFHPERGCLIINCRRCRSEVCRVAVAEATVQ